MRRPTIRRGAPLLAAAAMATALLAGCGSSDAAGTTSTTKAAKPTTTVAVTEKTVSKGGTTTTAAGSTDVVKDVLAVTKDPPGAPGSTLTLIRYTIPPGAKLAPHIHPGVQLAAIQSGQLTYTIVSGTATVQRAGADAPEQVTGPKTINLGPGDAVTEVDGMVHYGANDTTGPIVIDATLLTKDGEDLAVPVDPASAN